MRNSNTPIFGLGLGRSQILVMLWFVHGVVSDQVCYTTLNGALACTNPTSFGTRVAMSITGFIFLMLFFWLGYRLFSRAQRYLDEEARVVYVEPAQIQGPLPAPGDLGQGHIPAAGEQPFPVSPGGQAKPGLFPAMEQRHFNVSGMSRPLQTAPVSYYHPGSYPFPGYSPRPPPPQTAVIGGQSKLTRTGQN